MKNSSSSSFISFLVLILAIVLLQLWWLPQKWNACAKLYDNIPARVMCFGKK